MKYNKFINYFLFLITLIFLLLCLIINTSFSIVKSNNNKINQSRVINFQNDIKDNKLDLNNYQGLWYLSTDNYQDYFINIKYDSYNKLLIDLAIKNYFNAENIYVSLNNNIGKFEINDYQAILTFNKDSINLQIINNAINENYLFTVKSNYLEYIGVWQNDYIYLNIKEINNNVIIFDLSYQDYFFIDLVSNINNHLFFIEDLDKFGNILLKNGNVIISIDELIENCILETKE